MSSSKKQHGSFVQRLSDKKFRSLPQHLRALSVKGAAPHGEDEGEDGIVIVDEKSASQHASNPSDLPLVASSMNLSSPLTSSSFARSLMNPSVVYHFRIANFQSFSASTSGSLSSAISCDPSSISNSDWTALTSLFDEVKLVRSRISVSVVRAAGASGAEGSYILGYARSLTSSTTPGTYNAVAALPDSVQLAGGAYSSASHVVRSAAAVNTLWAPIATPAGPVDTGCTGVWWLLGSGLSASSRVIDTMIEIFIAMRARA